MTRDISYQDQKESKEAVDLFEFDSGDMLKEVANGS